jgi:hypothetical protein
MAKNLEKWWELSDFILVREAGEKEDVVECIEGEKSSKIFTF